MTILRGHGRLEGSQKVGLREPSGVDRVLTAKDVIIATGSDPFVPPGIETDGRTVFTSDGPSTWHGCPAGSPSSAAVTSALNSLMFTPPSVAKSR